MSNISGDWTGKIYGTNNADIFCEISQSETSVSAIVRINDPIFGLAVYEFLGVLDERRLTLEGDPAPDSTKQNAIHSMMIDGKKIEVQTQVVSLGHVKAEFEVTAKGELDGKWSSSIGTGGTVWLSRNTGNAEDEPFEIAYEPENIAFIMMGISSSNSSLEDTLNAIKRATKKHDIEAKRVDEIEHSKKITDVILGKLKTAKLLICDISTERPNVYYELGYAHGLDKDVILTAKEGTVLHFDIKDYNVIFYKNFSELEVRVSKRIEEILQESK